MRRPPTLTAGGIIVALAGLSDVATLAVPVPLPVVVIALVLAAAAVVALVGVWMRKAWGRWIGAATLAGTIVTAAPGIVFSHNQGLAVFAIVTVALAAIGITLLVIPTSREGFAS